VSGPPESVAASNTAAAVRMARRHCLFQSLGRKDDAARASIAQHHIG